MGTDKAMLPLCGRSLLRHTVDRLRAVPSFRDEAKEVVVTVIGERSELEGADRVIVDRFPGCGPLGGMEAALRDLRDNHGSIGAEFAFFLPVDMPFLPVGLIEALVAGWVEAGRHGAKVGYAVVDERPQPLVSMVHTSLHPFLEQALTVGHFKVTAVLQSAADVLASCHADGIGFRNLILCRTPISVEGTVPGVEGWSADEALGRSKLLWFSNLNNEEEFREAETFAVSPGFSW